MEFKTRFNCNNVGDRYECDITTSKICTQIYLVRNLFFKVTCI